MPKLLTRLKINEVSSVNRGAGEGVKILLMKRAFTQDERDHAAKTGAAMPDGSFPIHDASDLTNAIRLAGNAKDPAAAKAHIKQRAKDLGLSDQLPDSWGASTKTEKSASYAVASIMEKAQALGADAEKVRHAAKTLGIVAGNIEKLAEGEQLPLLEKSVSQCVEYLKGLVPEGKRDEFTSAVADLIKGEDSTTMTKEEQERMDKLEKSNGELTATLARLTLESAIGKLGDRAKAYIAEMKKADGSQDVDKVNAFLKKDQAAQDDEMQEADDAKKRKAKDVSKGIVDAIEDSPIVKQLKSTVADLEKKLTGIDNSGTVAAFAKKATDLGLKESDGEIMRKAYGGDAAAQGELEKLLKGLTEQARTGALFSEFGKSDSRTHGTAYAEIVAKAEELRKTDGGKGLTKHQAVNKIMSDPANAQLVARTKAESLSGRAAA